MLIGNVPNNVSKAHKRVAELFNEIKPGHRVFCEHNVSKFLEIYWARNGSPENSRDALLLKRAKRLHFDFFDSTANIVFEVQGEQHKEFVSFFHKDVGGLDRQNRNDSIKVRACKTAETKMIEISSDDNITPEQFVGFYRS